MRITEKHTKKGWSTFVWGIWRNRGACYHIGEILAGSLFEDALPQQRVDVLQNGEDKRKNKIILQTSDFYLLVNY